MTHHGRRGGRALELVLLFGLLGLTIALIGMGFFGAALLAMQIQLEGRIAAILPLFGAILGGLAAGQVWKKFLKYYRYSSALIPIKDPPKSQKKFRSGHNHSAH